MFGSFDTGQLAATISLGDFSCGRFPFEFPGFPIGATAASEGFRLNNDFIHPEAMASGWFCFTD
jgi:hypothetical protein